jgi:uncharacterized protein (TIGR00255 family)
MRGGDLGTALSIHSMTGYGRGSSAGQRFRVTAELRSVNGRFLEIRPKMPRSLSFLEPKARALVEVFLKRGVIDVAILVQPVEGAVESNLNLALAKSYLEMANQVAAATGVPSGLQAIDLLRVPGVVSAEDPTTFEKDPEIGSLVEVSLKEALQQLLSMRAAEGAKLASVISRELEELRSRREWIYGHREEINEKYLAKIRGRMKDWAAKTQGLDETRLAQEVAFYLDRSDVTEELDRLASHLAQCQDALSQADTKSVGKRLEFLTQELGREVNTIGAKSDHLPITQAVLEMKLVLEKIREQVQNLE